MNPFSVKAAVEAVYIRPARKITVAEQEQLALARQCWRELNKKDRHGQVGSESYDELISALRQTGQAEQLRISESAISTVRRQGAIKAAKRCLREMLQGAASFNRWFVQFRKHQRVSGQSPESLGVGRHELEQLAAINQQAMLIRQNELAAAKLELQRMREFFGAQQRVCPREAEFSYFTLDLSFGLQCDQIQRALDRGRWTWADLGVSAVDMAAIKNQN